MRHCRVTTDSLFVIVVTLSSYYFIHYPRIGEVVCPKPGGGIRAMVNPLPSMMQPHVPQRVWIGVRHISIVMALMLIATAILWPEWGLRITWKIIVPLVPILLFIAPGLWRNICPLAATNQLPRLFKFTRHGVLPHAVRDNAHLVAIGLLLAIVPLRQVILNESGLALAVFLIVVFGLAFTGGFLFRGKSGWCSQFCPMIPVEQAYGQTPFIMVRNSHCSPCLQCTKHCFDRNPTAAYLADLNDSDQRWTAQRRLFIGMLPGFILGYFYNADLTAGEPWFAVYGLMLFLALISLGIFVILDTVLRVSTRKIASGFVVGALNLYYWYSFPVLLGQIGDGLNQISWPTGVTTAGDEVNVVFRVVLHVALVVLSIIWLKRTLAKERRFAERLTPTSPQISPQ